MTDVHGKVFMCGNNECGQLGLGVIDYQNPLVHTPVMLEAFRDCAKEVACGELHTIILSLSGLVYSCGDNGLGQLGDGTRN